MHTDHAMLAQNILRAGDEQIGAGLIRAAIEEARRKALSDAINEAAAYGRRVPMARTYADRIAEAISALLHNPNR